MEITYDWAKNAQNILERNLSFDQVVDFDFETANFTIDKRKDYGEIRRCAIGYLDRDGTEGVQKNKFASKISTIKTCSTQN